MPSLPMSTMVTVNVTVDSGPVSIEDFGLLCYFTEDTTLDQGEYATYNTLADVVAAGFSETGSVYKYCATFFAQDPQPTKIAIARVDTTGGDTWPGVIETTRENLDFYAVGIDTLDLDQATLLTIATQVADDQLLWVQVRRNSDIATIVAALQAADNRRVAFINKDTDDDSNRIDAALYGAMLTKQTGAFNWGNRTLGEVNATELSVSNQNALLDDRINIYTSVAKTDVLLRGETCSESTPTFIDQIQAEDWLRINIQTEVQYALVNYEVTYDDAGMKILLGQVQKVLNQAQTLRILADDVRPTATAPSVLTVSAEQRAARIGPTITATGRLSGQINTITVNVQVEI